MKNKKGFRFDQRMKYIISPSGDEMEWCYVTQWLNDLQSDLDAEVDDHVKSKSKVDKLEEKLANLSLVEMSERTLKNSLNKRQVVVERLRKINLVYKQQNKELIEALEKIRDIAVTIEGKGTVQAWEIFEIVKKHLSSECTEREK